MSALRIIPIGGMGNVTQNMYIYEYEDEMMIFDCGIGFPTSAMPGVDVMIPDITYLKEQLERGRQIVGMVLTHGHDDHIGALPYILPELPEFSIYASPLTAGFAQNRMADGGVEREITVFKDGEKFKIGQYFEVEGFPMTHSVPDTRHFAVSTPEGVIYHGSDFKIDLQPVDHVLPDFDTISRIGKEGVLCMLMDCLRVEREGWSKSESAVYGALEESMIDVKGKYIVTLMSSHIHRIQQVVNIAAKFDRKVVFIGRSVEQNVEVARQLNKLFIPAEMVVNKRDIQNYKDSELCIVIAGSQGQEGSSLVRAIYGEHPVLQIKKQDRVVFSSDAIPGNELPYFDAIDELCRNGVRVLYPDVVPDLHQSGHGGAMEQQMMVALVKPKYLFPMGGQDRHREKFFELVGQKMGYQENQVVIPAHGDIVEFEGGIPRLGEHLNLQPRLVDGLGVGDVGRSVLSDRRALGTEGMIVLVIPKVAGRLDLENINVVSRGFVFMKEAQEVVDFIKQTTHEIVDEVRKNAKGDDSDEEVRRAIERRLGRRLYKIIRREPMILPVIMEV
ncbi:ribonuclease J [Patescibacteria group bacterium]|nr:ribonuclease J [Patescibacteria group bacterium]